MEKVRKDPREELKKFCQKVLENDNDLDFHEMKETCLKIYEALVLAEVQEAEPVAEEPEIPMEGIQEVVTILEEKVDLIEETSDPKPEKMNESSDDQEYPTLSDLFVPTFDDIKDDMSQKEEFKDTVSLEETEKLFQTKKEEPRQLSLNDRLVGNSIQVGLNDRIAFVNKLFNFSQSDFNKVLNTLNTFDTKEEAFHYVQYQVKSTYNWKGKEELEERFMLLIERKFMI